MYRNLWSSEVLDVHNVMRTPPVNIKVIPTYRRRQASAAKAETKTSEDQLFLFKKLGTHIMKKRTSNINTGSDHAITETLRTRFDNRTERIPRTANAFDLMHRMNSFPEARTIRPNVTAFRSRAPSKGSMPTNPSPANNVGNKGGHLVYGIPSKSKYPLPDNRLLAADT